MSDVVTVRVSKALREKVRRYGISVSKITREALEEEIRKHESRELADAVGEMKTLLSKIPDDEIVRAIRESRDQR
ncbi:type II toxin-antitoxin system CcdA family antitoxin [Candidatus Bathyarchaeota archaeon]|jgi:hypothetical protein|nr:type II toxin-antitoxin system CcdA family antitoxin [Candidatus Bathyarchaeota archaeon]